MRLFPSGGSGDSTAASQDPGARVPRAGSVAGAAAAECAARSPAHRSRAPLAASRPRHLSHGALPTTH